MPPRLPGSSRPMGSKLGPDGLLDPKTHGLDPNKPKAVRIRKRDVRALRIALRAEFAARFCME